MSAAAVIIPFESKLDRHCQPDTIYIDPEISQLPPPLTHLELQRLQANLIEEGCRDALVVWAGHRILLDGHHRYELCTKLGIEFSVIEKEFPTKDAALAWIISNQLGRRNLSSYAISYLRGMRYNLEKKNVGHPQLHQNDGITKYRLGKEYSVGPATIERDARFAHAVNELSQDNPEIKRQILAGKTLLTKQQIGDIGEIAKTDREKALSRFLDLNENLCVKRSQGQPKKKPKLIDSIIDDSNKTYPYQIGNKVEVVTQIGGWDIGERSVVIDVCIKNQKVKLFTEISENKESWLSFSVVQKVTTTLSQLPHMVLKINLPGKIVPKARPRVSKNGTYMPQQYQDWRKSAKLEVLKQIRIGGIDIPVPKPCNLLIKMRGQSMNADLDNLAGALMDCLVDASVIAQDNLGHVSQLYVEHIESDFAECEIEISLPKQ